MPKRTFEQPVTLITKFQAPKGLEPMKLHTSSTLGAGMVTSLDPADIKPEALQLSLNTRVNFDKTKRRAGLTRATPDAPDTNPVVHLGYIKLPDNTNSYIVRITPSTVYYRPQGGSWQIATGAIGGTITDGITDSVIILPTGPPYYVFANNGVNEIQKVLFDPTNTVSDLRAGVGVSTKYRYITGFYNRVFAAALAGVNECQIGWSGDGNITVWDPSVDSTAGNSPLIDSPDDESDFIKGIIGFTNILVVIRTRSIWHGTKLPIPTQPVNFYAAIPGIGCDCPNSFKITTEGLVWVDTRTATVWSYTPGRWPVPIGRPIEKDLINSIYDPNLVYASYNSQNFEYTVVIAQPSTKDVISWTYNFRNSAWVKDYIAGDYIVDSTGVGVSAINDFAYQTGGLTIGQLVGTIGNLQGTIGSLGSASAIFNSRVYGVSDGNILVEDSNSSVDQIYAPGVAFETDLVSKAFTLDYSDEYIARVRINYKAYANGSFTVWFSKDGGATFTAIKTINFSTLNVSQLVTIRKSVKTRRFAWKLTSTTGSWEILDYEIEYYPGAESRA